MQQQYVEKPVKVLGEQYFSTLEPPPAGVCLCEQPGLEGPVIRPHVHCVEGLRYCADTDWILASRYSENTFLDVIPDEEFQARFGTPAPAFTDGAHEGDI